MLTLVPHLSSFLFSLQTGFLCSLFYIPRLWLVVAPALHLMPHHAVVQGPDSKFTGRRTLLAQQTIPDVICCGQGGQ